jgi:aminopeptidase-like protein
VTDSGLEIQRRLDDTMQEMLSLIHELYPLCRSITGHGVRDTLRALRKHIPVTTYEVPSGTQVFDWTIPKEWNIRDAYVKNARGQKIIDFQRSNLHVVGYSIPIHRTVSLMELRKHLFSLPDYPDWIPYRTSYYQETWGFCVSHRQYESLIEEAYEVYIDSSLADGSLSYGEYYIPGKQADEVLVSCHICHPSLCNDNLSGIALNTLLAKYLSTQSLLYSYRFLFIPGTIGSIAWLSANEEQVSKIKHGMVVACVGDAGISTYKKSRRGDAEIDRAVEHVLKYSGQDYKIVDFSPYGYDERQFCSPGFNLPVGCLMRTPHGCFPEYHTSGDNLSFIQPLALVDSFSKCLSILRVIEQNKIYINLNPKCEPRLGKRGLYRTIGGHVDKASAELAMLWVLNFSDGEHTLLDIAERAGMGFDRIKTAADALMEHNLIQEKTVSSLV